MPKIANIDKLPDDIKTQLNEKLIEAGFGDYINLSKWLAEQGYQISKSAVGRHGADLKERMEKSLTRAMERMEIAKSLRGASDEEKAALLEASELTATDALMDILESLPDMELHDRAKNVPKLVGALANLNRSAVGSAKWKREFEAEIRKQTLQELTTAMEQSEKFDKKTLDSVRSEILEKVLGKTTTKS
jgi:hypothetical protein